MKFIKIFETHDPDYLNYINSEDVILPNLSYCKDIGDVHLNKIETRLVAKYNVTDTTIATNIMNSSATSQFSEIEIDEVVQPSVVSTYTFDTTGEHTIKYTLVNPTEIPFTAFEFCTRLTSITIPDNITTISNSAFENCNGLTSVTLGKSVTTIGQSAFRYCGITSLIIPDSVTSIGQSAFADCSGLTSVSIPNSVTTIGKFAFSNCTGLTSVTIGNSVTSIGSYAFRACSILSSVTVQATTPPTLSSELNY